MIDEFTDSVDSEGASADRVASEQDRRKMDLTVNLRLGDATRAKSSLKDVMTEISRNAQARGLTPEALQRLLDDQ